MLGLVFVCSPAAADETKFQATGAATVSGFVEFDSSAISGGFTVSNSNITDLSLTVMGYSFDFGDVDTGASTLFNATGDVIVNGAGALASNGSETIAFFPDGFGGTATDGDASLALDTDGSFTFGGSGWEAFIAVSWQQVPEPSMLALLGVGAVAIAARRRRRRARA